ncbi:MAG TPA: tetratricopeptide repeat protein [Thermoanaerobaculia bacterium]|jgi:tetratricopeptide (TPR) repeat protein|nr:tetratricopeptide repeat protein [Thermoanaerobaculia bacterium]
MSDLPPTVGRLIAGEEEARRRIARELHDDHCQRLAALGFELEAVRRQVAEDDPRRSGLDILGANLAGLGEDLRRLSHELHPAILERRGLSAALRDACGEIERRHGLPVRLSLPQQEDQLPRLPHDIALGLYRIAQEALSNIIRHAAAREVHVTLRISSRQASLSVADDGAGFDADEANQADGLGLASIEERAGLLGGRCRFISAPGAGTEIEVSVPLPEPEGMLTQLRRGVRRHRRLAGSVALILLALAGGLVATASQARRAREEATRADAVAQFLEDLFQSADPRQTRGGMPDARELLRRGTGRLANELQDQPLLRARLLDTLGAIHTDLGLYDEARPLLAEALEVRERLNGPEDPEVADTLVHLGAVAHLSGKGEAVPLFSRALTIREELFGPEHPDVAGVLNNLGAAFAARGRFDEAEAALRRTLAIQEKLWGKRDPRVAKAMHNLGGIAYYRGSVEEAERLLLGALEIREAALPEDDLDLAGSREAMALLRQKQGRPAEAAILLERLAATNERVYGPGHPQLARTLLNLGLAHVDLGEDDDARPLFERALAIEEAALEPAHPQLVRTIASLADLHCRQKRYAEAEPLFRRLMKLREEGATYDLWDKTLANWTRLLRETGREGEAAQVR